MSDNTAEPRELTPDEDVSTPRAVLRTVTPPYIPRPGGDIGGWTMFLGLLVLLVPLLPFIAIVWVLSKAFEALGSDDPAR